MRPLSLMVCATLCLAGMGCHTMKPNPTDYDTANLDPETGESWSAGRQARAGQPVEKNTDGWSWYSPKARSIFRNLGVEE